MGKLVRWGSQFGFDMNKIVRNHTLWKAHEHVLRLSRDYLKFLTYLNELGLFQHGEFMIPTMCHYTSHRCVKFTDHGSGWRYSPSLTLTQWSEAEAGKWYHPLKLDQFTEFEEPAKKDAFYESLS